MITLKRNKLDEDTTKSLIIKLIFLVTKSAGFELDLRIVSRVFYHCTTVIVPNLTRIVFNKTNSRWLFVNGRTYESLSYGIGFK